MANFQSSSSSSQSSFADVIESDDTNCSLDTFHEMLSETYTPDVLKKQLKQAMKIRIQMIQAIRDVFMQLS